MFCTDFIFDGELLSDHNLMICNLDGSEPSQSGGDVTFITTQPPSSDKQTYYTSKCEDPIVFTFQIGKNICEITNQEDMYFSQSEQSRLKRWLKRLDGYHWLSFQQEGFDVWFHVQFNLQPYYFDGHVIGYDVTGNTDSSYGYSEEYTNTFDLDIGEKYELDNDSDIPGKLYPQVTITAKGNGTVRIESGYNDSLEETEIINVISGDVLVLDGNDDYFDGVRYPDYFNFVFPIMVNDYSSTNTYFNNIGTIDLEMKIKYRYVRMVDI